MTKNKVGDVISHAKLGKKLWIVVKTQMTGGCQGRDPYPDGHQITCLPINGAKIDHRFNSKKYYQSGCFNDTVMLPFIKPLKQFTVWSPPLRYYTSNK